MISVYCDFSKWTTFLSIVVGYSSEHLSGIYPLSFIKLPKALWAYGGFQE